MSNFWNSLLWPNLEAKFRWFGEFVVPNSHPLFFYDERTLYSINAVNKVNLNANTNENCNRERPNEKSESCRIETLFLILRSVKLSACHIFSARVIYSPSLYISFPVSSATVCSYCDKQSKKKKRKEKQNKS